MHSKLRRKLILSISSCALTALCLASTTYAWFSRNGDAWTDDFEFDILTDVGLELSVDGVNYSQGVSGDMLKNQIQKILDEQNNGQSINSLVYKGVTMKQTDGKIDYNAADVASENQYLKYKQAIFTEDALEGDEAGIQTHTFTNAIPNQDYVVFDLWARVIFSEANGTDTYNLYMSDLTSVQGTLRDVVLRNSLTTIENGEKVDKQSGDVVKVNPANAMRIALYNDETSKMSVYELTDDNDLGSAAIEGRDDLKHNKNNNAMYTYYNNYYPLYPFQGAAVDGEAFNTLSKSDLKTGNVNENKESVGTFTYDSVSKKYNTIHLRTYIYLEGWDADFFVGIPVDGGDIKVNLGLRIDKVN